MYAQGNIELKQIQGELGQLPLTPPFSDEKRRPSRDRSPLGSLRASERRVRLVGRDNVIDSAIDWMNQPPVDGPDHRVLVVHGPGGAGKTRLAAEILQRAKEAGWLAGFLSESARVYPYLSHITHPSRPTMVAVDYAEARYVEMRRLFAERPVDHEGDAPFRAILIVREGVSQADAWLHRLEGEGDLGSRAEDLLRPDVLTVVSLDESLPSLADREELWMAGVEASESKADSVPGYLSDPLFERPLLVLLDVHRVLSEPDSAGATVPTEDSLFASILKHERRYWASAAEDLDLKLTDRRMNQVAALATLVGGVARSAFEAVLRSLDWLQDDEDLLLSLSDWWCAVYETGAGAIRGVEPDIVGEYLVMRALGPRDDSKEPLDGCLQVDRLRSLIGLATPAGRQRLLQVLTRIASSGSEGARAVLTELLDLHLMDFLPAAFTQAAAGPNLSDRAEPLAMTVASAVLACDRLQLVSATPGTAEIGNTDEGEASEAIHETAVGIVRRQIEAVALRELDAERWSAERFADVMTWALRFDLEAGEIARAEREISQIEKLEPRPYMALATMRRELGRDHLAAFRHSEATDILEAALEDIEAAGEQESQLSYLLKSDLGDAVQQLGDTERAASLHEDALEGLRRIEGPAADSTIAVLHSLVYSVALLDLDDALQRRDAAVAELAADGAPEEAINKVRIVGSGALLAAGRAALQAGESEAAEDLFQRALEEVEAADERESMQACVIIDSLGLAAAAQGETERAVSFLKEALEGKRRIRDGYDHPGTIATLLGLASRLAEIDLDRAVELLGKVAAELREAGSPRRATVVNAQVSLLSKIGRIGAGLAVIRDDDEATLAREVRRAALDTIADPALPPVLPPFAVAVDATATAAELFDPHDARLAAFASRLGLLAVERASAAVGIRITPAALADIAQGREAHPDVRRLAGGLQMPELDTGSKAAAEALVDVQRRIRDAVRQLSDDPAVVGAGILGQGAVPELVGADPVREWLLRCGQAGEEIPGVETDAVVVGGLLAWSLSADAGLSVSVPIASEAARVWRHPPDAETLAAEEERLRQELVRLEIATESEATTVVRMSVASGCISASRLALEDGDLDEAEELCKEAAATLHEVDRSDSGLALVLRERLAAIAAKRGDFPRAADHAEAALNGWRAREEEAPGPQTVDALLAFAKQSAHLDLDRALSLVAAEIDTAEAANAHATMIKRLRRGRIEILHAAAARALADGDSTLGKVLSVRASEELEAIGDKTSLLYHVVLYDLGVSLLQNKDREGGIEQLDTALSGMKASVGPADVNTQRCAATLARALATEDPAAALALVDGMLGECEGADPESLANLRTTRARSLRQLGHLKLKESDPTTATALLAEAMDELAVAGELDAFLAHVIAHDLGDRALEKGDFAEARSLYRKAMEGKRRLRGTSDSETLISLAAYAEAHAYFDLRAALELITTAIAEAESDGASTEAVERLRLSRSLVYEVAASRALDDGRFEEAVCNLEQAIEIIAQCVGKETEMYCGALDQLARTMLHRDEHRREDIERAAELLREAHSGYRKLAGPSDPRSIVVLARLADATAGFDPEAAASILDDGIAELEAEERPTGSIEPLRRALGGVRFLQGRAAMEADQLDEAAARFEAAREQLLRGGGDGSIEIYVVIHELGELAALRGDRETAERWMREAIAGKRSQLGLADRDTLYSIIALAEIQARQDLESGIATLEEAIAELDAAGASKELTDYVVGGMAMVYLQSGREAEARGELDEAERLYGRALEENAKVEGEGEQDLASVLTHDLADVAVKREDSEQAIGLYREALEGKRRVRGLADPGTIDTLIGLANALARNDVAAATELLKATVIELEEMDAPPELVTRVRDRHVPIHLHAGRAAAAAGNGTEAERLFKIALEELEAKGEGETHLACIARHDLALVRIEQEDFEEAADLLRVVYETNRRIRGPADPDTLRTLLKLSEALGVSDSRRAVEVTGRALEELRGEGADPDAMDAAQRARARALLGLGFDSLRAGETAAARESFEEAIEQLDSSSTVESELRLGLLHGLAEVAEREGDHERAVELFREAYEGMRHHAELTDPLVLRYLIILVRALSRSEPEEALSVLGQVAEEIGEGDARVVQVLVGPRLSALVAAGQKAAVELNLELAGKRYREALSYFEDLKQEDSEAALLVKKDLGEVTVLEGDYGKGVDLLEQAWRGLQADPGPRSKPAIAAQLALADGLVTVDPTRSLEVLDGLEGEVDAEHVAFTRATALLHCGRLAGDQGELDAAEASFVSGLEQITVLGEKAAYLIGVITHDLGDVATRRNEFERAAQLYTAALELKRTSVGLGVEDTLTTLFALAYAMARNDELADAFALMDSAPEELEGAEDEEHLVELIQYFRCGLHLPAGRAAEADGNWDEAERLYGTVLSELERNGLRDSDLAYATLHDLGDVALARKDYRAAVSLYEESLRGKRRMVGFGAADTQTTLLRLAEALMGVDPPAAFTMLESAEEELAAEGNDRAVARIKDWLEAQEPPADDAADAI